MTAEEELRRAWFNTGYNPFGLDADMIKAAAEVIRRDDSCASSLSWTDVAPTALAALTAALKVLAERTGRPLGIEAGADGVQ